MSALLMVGAQPDNDNSLTSREYADTRQALTSVTQGQVDAELNVQLADRATKAYVDQRDALKVTKSYVDTQDAKLIPKTALGSTSGVAKLDANIQVPVSQLQNAPRGWTIAHLATMNTTSSFSSASSSRRLLGTLSMPDPGYKWTPLVSGAGFETYVTGSDSRGDVSVNLNSASGTAVGYGTGKLNVGDAYRGHVEVVTDSNAGAYTGGVTIYISAFRGYGSGTVTFYPDLAWLTVIAMPVV